MVSLLERKIFKKKGGEYLYGYNCDNVSGNILDLTDIHVYTREIIRSSDFGILENFEI